jgi:hypothetical protein
MRDSPGRLAGGPCRSSSLDNIGYDYLEDQGVTGREAFDLRESGTADPEHHLYVCRSDSDELAPHGIPGFGVKVPGDSWIGHHVPFVPNGESPASHDRAMNVWSRREADSDSWSTSGFLRYSFEGAQ